MSLIHALLGFLSLGPLTGYDLKKHIDASTTFFWHAELAQIYPALKHLEESGLIESAVESQASKPDKRIYTITPAGRVELRDWLRQPLDHVPPKKDPTLLRLFFSGSLDQEAILDQLRHQLALHQAQLSHYQTNTQAYIHDIIAQTGLDREGVMWELVREYGVEHERSYVRWLEHAIKEVETTL